MIILTKLKNFLDDKEKIIILFFVFLVLISHSIISLFHLHECDSSDVYKYLTDYSIFSRGHFIGHIWKTGSIFTPLRILFALTVSIIPFDFIKSSILLPLKMTYPPLEGFIYGLYLPDRFGLFYEYASFMNIIFFISLFIFLVIISHSIISLFHFHECDSSDVYKYLTDSSIFSRGHFIGHIWKTGSIFTPLRILFGLTVSIIPFDFIKSSILLPLKMTYPPLEGFIYGLYLPDRF